jgi:hypothetical protein
MLIKGVAKATNKDDLIQLMCKYNCMYRTSHLPEIYPAPKPVAATAAVSNEFVLDYVQRNFSDASSSDSEAPISKAAVKVAVAAAAAATAGAGAKRKTVYAPLCCTGTPKNDPLCTCDFCMLPPPPPHKKPSAKK